MGGSVIGEWIDAQILPIAGDAAQYPAEFPALNPHGRVPAVAHGGGTVVREAHSTLKVAQPNRYRVRY